MHDKNAMTDKKKCTASLSDNGVSGLRSHAILLQKYAFLKTLILTRDRIFKGKNYPKPSLNKQTALKSEHQFRNYEATDIKTDTQGLIWHAALLDA